MTRNRIVWAMLTCSLVLTGLLQPASAAVAVACEVVVGKVYIQGSPDSDTIIVRVHPTDASSGEVLARDPATGKLVQICTFSLEDTILIQAYLGDGDDLLRTSKDITASCDLNGEGGDDTMRGGSGDDPIKGGPGNDTLEGSDGADVLVADPPMSLSSERRTPERDVLKGGVGDDELRAKDGNSDKVIGGGGSDSAETDTVDKVKGVETYL